MPSTPPPSRRGARCRERRGSRSVRTAADRPSGWARQPAAVRRSCSPSTTIGGRKRTSPDGNGTMPRSSIPGSGRSTPCRSSARPSTMPDSRSRWWRSSDRRRWWRVIGRHLSASSSSTAGTVTNRPDSTTRGGHRMWRSVASSPSTTSSPIRLMVAARRTNGSSARRSSAVASACWRPPGRCASCAARTDPLTRPIGRRSGADPIPTQR